MAWQKCVFRTGFVSWFFAFFAVAISPPPPAAAAADPAAAASAELSSRTRLRTSLSVLRLPVCVFVPSLSWQSTPFQKQKIVATLICCAPSASERHQQTHRPPFPNVRGLIPRNFHLMMVSNQSNPIVFPTYQSP